MEMQFLFETGEAWIESRDGDPSCRAIFDRHYSRRRYKDGRRPKLFVGPGQKMVLRTADGKALFVWRRFHDDSGQIGVNCAVFRNEGEFQSSWLIRRAVQMARERWPNTRLYTYVNADKVKSPNPGYCFKAAGWSYCGRTKGGLHILELARGSPRSEQV